MWPYWVCLCYNHIRTPDFLVRQSDHYNFFPFIMVGQKLLCHCYVRDHKSYATPVLMQVFSFFFHTERQIIFLYRTMHLPLVL